MERRHFIKASTLAAGSLLLQAKSFAAANEDERLVVLHTNDVHSRIDPFPLDGGRNAGQAGVAARAALISKIRKEEKNVLLLDAGDMFQGTPYFNLYKGEPELKAMSAMGYDGGTIGNHDFDAGIENLQQQLRSHASFPMIICNYNFSGTPIENSYVPYKIFRRGRLKIGVLGVGIELQGLVPQNLYGATQYLDPIAKANETAALLRNKNCDLIICLSHLGYKYSNNQVSDIVLAKETENIDLIIGGHTHTFLPAPVTEKNKIGKDVLINQVGFAGLQLGRLDFSFKEKNKNAAVQSSVIAVTKKTEI